MHVKLLSNIEETVTGRAAAFLQKSSEIEIHIEKADINVMSADCMIAINDKHRSVSMATIRNALYRCIRHALPTNEPDMAEYYESSFLIDMLHDFLFVKRIISHFDNCDIQLNSFSNGFRVLSELLVVVLDRMENSGE